MNELKTIQLEIIQVLRDWYDDYYWIGYNGLFDTICEKYDYEKYSITELKKAMKQLWHKGYVVILPLFDEDTDHLCGSGWFLTTKGTE